MTAYYVWVLFVIAGDGNNPSAINRGGITIVDNIATAAECQDLAIRTAKRLPQQFTTVFCQQVQKTSPK